MISSQTISFLDSFLETVSEYQSDDKMWQFLSQSGHETCTTSTTFLPLPVTS